MALDPELPVEAVVATLGCLDDQLDLNLYLSHLQGSRDETGRQVLRLIAGDKQRHVLFAWTLLVDRMPRLDAKSRAAVADAVRDMLERVLLTGYRNSWLLPAGARDGGRQSRDSEASCRVMPIGARRASERTAASRSSWSAPPGGRARTPIHQTVWRSESELVCEAPTPFLTGLKRAHDRMLGPKQVGDMYVPSVLGMVGCDPGHAGEVAATSDGPAAETTAGTQWRSSKSASR